MITLLNMIFANPLAYRVFPLIANPYNTGITDTAIYTGYILVTDSNGTTKSFSNTNIIDFSGFTGTIDIDLYTDTGSVKLGRWVTSDSTTDWDLYDIYVYDHVPTSINDERVTELSALNPYPIDLYIYPIERLYIKGVAQNQYRISLKAVDERNFTWLSSFSVTECEIVDNYIHISGTVPAQGLNVNDTYSSTLFIGNIIVDGIKLSINDKVKYIFKHTTAKYELITDDSTYRTRVEYDPLTIPSTGGNITLNIYPYMQLYLKTDDIDDYVSINNSIYGMSIGDFSYTLPDWLTEVSFTAIETTDENPGILKLILNATKNTGSDSRVAEFNLDWHWTSDSVDAIYVGVDELQFSIPVTITQEVTSWIAPYTPGWSIGFSMTNQGIAARTITNGIEVLQTGADPDHDDNNFFGYTDDLYKGERFYSATIQVSGLPEGYTIIGIHGWDGVTITQDGEYTLPEFTWTNPSGYPDGTSIPYQDVPSLRFADGTAADVMFDTPITIVITAVQSMEESINEHMVLWYDLAKQGATNESMATAPMLIDHSGNGHDATCYNFAWSGMSGIGGRPITTDEIIVDGAYSNIQSIYGYSITAGNVCQEVKFRVTGITDTALVVRCIDRSTENRNRFLITVSEDGEYASPSFTNNSSTTETWEVISQIGTYNNVKIEILPIYPNSLVSDGVDDQCLVEGLPLLNKEDGYTVIAKRKIPSEGQYCLSSKRKTTSPDGAYVFELKASNAERSDSFGYQNNVTGMFEKSDISWQTSKSYNGTSISVGDMPDNDVLNLFTLSRNNYFCKAVLYSFILFNRDLSTDEIEWVKTNLIETEQ